MHMCRQSPSPLDLAPRRLARGPAHTSGWMIYIYRYMSDIYIWIYVNMCMYVFICVDELLLFLQLKRGWQAAQAKLQD